MRNPIRTVVDLVRPPGKRAGDEPGSARKPTAATRTPGSREDLLLAAVREEFESFTHDVASEQARVHEEFTDALDSLRALLTVVEEADAARVDELRDELRRTREGLGKSVAETRRRSVELEAAIGEDKERVDRIEQGLGALADLVEKQLHSTERSLLALRDSGERRVRDLEESHRRQMESLERGHESLVRAAESSRQRLASRVDAVASWLENGPTSIESGTETAAPSNDEPPPENGAKPKAGLAGWLRGESRLQARLDALEARAERFERLLEERSQESRTGGEALRRALREKV